MLQVSPRVFQQSAQRRTPFSSCTAGKQTDQQQRCGLGCLQGLKLGHLHVTQIAAHTVPELLEQTLCTLCEWTRCMWQWLEACQATMPGSVG
jgi:hypothetical protein